MKNMKNSLRILGVVALVICLFAAFSVTAFAVGENVAKNENTGVEYGTLQAAINAVADGETITLLNNVSDNVTIKQADGKSFTIDGDGNSYSGKLTISGEENPSGTETLTFKNITFNRIDRTAKSNAIVSTKSAHNVTFDACTFNGSTAGYFMVNAAGNPTYDYRFINKCVIDMDGNFWEASASTNNLIVDGMHIKKCTSNTFKFNYGGNSITATFNGITVDDAYVFIYGMGYSNMSFVINNCTINAAFPFIRQDKAVMTYEYTFKGNNAIKANPDATAPVASTEHDGLYLVSGGNLGATVKWTVDKPAYPVQIGEQGFETLADALEAAQVGDTITFLADINENVALTKDIIIDGANLKYTGTMNIGTVENVTIQNVNFVKGSIDGDTSALSRKLTVKGCTFDGVDNSIGYAITVRHGSTVVIENSSATNYGVGMLYIPQNVASITVKKVTVSNAQAAFNISYSGPALFEEVAFENVGYGIHFQIWPDGSRTYIVKNSDLSGATNPFWFWDKSNNTEKVTIRFEGENIVPKFQPISYTTSGILKLAAGATLTAPENIAITTVDGYEVVYEDGIHTSKVAKAPSGEVAYRADVTDKADREGIAILLKNVYAKNSLVVKVYHNDTLMFTSARRDIDDEGKVMFPVNANTTANIVLWGKESGSWINEILAKPNELNVPNKIEVWADGVLVSTYTHESGTVLGVNLDKYLALDVVQQPVAKVGTKTYKTLQAAIDACPAGGKVTLLRDAKGAGVVINKSITINFNGKTYYVNKGVGSTGTESNGFQILAGNKVTLSAGTLKVAEEAADKFYILVQNYAAELSLFNMNLDGTYLDKWAKTDGDSYVLSNNSGYISLTGKTYITTNNDGDKAFAFDACDSKYYADKPVVFAATTVKIDGKAISESYDKIEAAARIGSTQFFASLKEAFAYASNGNTIKLMADVAVSEEIINTKKVTLDLNGKTITGTDNATVSFGLITNKGTLTVKGDGKITLTATNNRGWNAYSSVISNQPGGKLIVERGTIEHLGGTDMAYGIDNLTNGKGTYAETVINGGTIKSTYRAIRMFLNGIEAQNILTVNGGVIEGANKSIWMQDPSKNANTGNLTVGKNATLNGDVYLTVTAGSTEWPVEVSIAASAVNGEVLTSNVPAGYKLVENKGVYSVEKVKVYIAQVGVTKYESLQAAIDACPDYGKVTLLRDAKGPGVVIDKNITILFNGHTYTITEPVGSKGTETLGFQILKGNKVVLNNGKIEIAEEAADKFAILIQNYADLTVYNMTLDGTNLGRYENYSYVLSVNCGNVKVNGKSVLTAKDGEGNYALDVYDYSSAGYSLPTVTVTSVVKIEGKCSYGAKYGTVYYATAEQVKR